MNPPPVVGFHYNLGQDVVRESMWYSCDTVRSYGQAFETDSGAPKLH